MTNSGSGNGFDVSAGGDGIAAHSSGSAKSGVWGNNTGAGYGVAGSTNSSNTAGVHGSNAGSGYGIHATSASGTALYAVASSGGSYTYAVKGINQASTGYGVYGESPTYGVWANFSASAAIYGVAHTSTGIGIRGYAAGDAPQYAGLFSGDVFVAGYLDKAGGGFRIDHPLDPANKILRHSFVESDQQKNLYDGVVVADGMGQAEVQLPDWFEALNADLRYQLTAIGVAAPNLHVAQEVSGGRMVIAGAPPGARISWQVSGVRRDAFVKARPFPIEMDKADTERGFYIHPEAHGQSWEKQIEWAADPNGLELMRKIRSGQRP